MHKYKTAFERIDTLSARYGLSDKERSVARVIARRCLDDEDDDRDQAAIARFAVEQAPDHV